MNEVKQLVADIKAKKIKPIYFLMGKEPYYIDKITDFIEETVLSEEEKDFNQMVLYGRDVTIDTIVSHAKRYPMMAEYQVVIVREAQDLYKTIENLATYAKNPQLTTILVIAYKYKTIDKRKTLYKALAKNGVVFEAKVLYDNQVPDWIRRVLKGQNYGITPKASQMLTEYLGTDLSRINNELNKLKVILPEGTQITPDHIEENIGISKEYNNFELHKAIGMRDELKAYKIIKYFGENPKDNPLVVTLALLYSYFTKLLKIHGLSDKSSRNVASTLGITPFFVNEYLTAVRNYPMKKISAIIATLRTSDVKSKGVGANNDVEHGDLLKEVMVQIFS